MLDVEREVSTNLLATCRELGVALVAYSPLGRGLLTSTFAQNEIPKGDAADMRDALFPRFQEENREINVKLVNSFTALADKKGCSTSQLAIAWLLKQGDDIIPIPGTKKINYLKSNFGALNVRLTAEEEVEIRKFVETAEIAGSVDPAIFAGHKVLDTTEE